MTVRFNCWIEADNLRSSWDELYKTCERIVVDEDKQKLIDAFSPTLLENPEEDKETISPERKISQMIQGAIDVINTLAIDDSTASYWLGYKKALLTTKEAIMKGGEEE